jgi:hypothetical protein
MRGAMQRLEIEHDARAWLAWHTAYLPAAKKRPKLKDLMVKRKARRQTVEEQIAIAKQWTAFMARKTGKGDS